MAIDLSEFRTERKRRCLPQILSDKLTLDDRLKFQAACVEPSITSRAITEWLRAKTGGQISEASLRKHRVKECACNA